MFNTSRIPRCLWALVTFFVVATSHGMDGSAPGPDRWFRDSVVMGSWVDTSWGKPPGKKPVKRKGTITWLHLGPTADCPHMVSLLPDGSCMDHWVASTNDDDPDLLIQWDSIGWGADLLLYRLVVYSPPGANYGTDSIEGPRVVGRVKLQANGTDTSLEVIYRGRKSILRRGPLPEAYEGNLEPPDLETDRLWFDSLHRAHLNPVGLVVPDPVRCLLTAHAARKWPSGSPPDIKCLSAGLSSRNTDTLIWTDPAGRWRVARIFGDDQSPTAFHDKILLRFPDHWRWIWWERRESALKSALSFVTGRSPSRSPAMDRPRLLFHTKEDACNISGRSEHSADPWFTLDVDCR